MGGLARCGDVKAEVLLYYTRGGKWGLMAHHPPFMDRRILKSGGGGKVGRLLMAHHPPSHGLTVLLLGILHAFPYWESF